MKPTVAINLENKFLQQKENCFNSYMTEKQASCDPNEPYPFGSQPTRKQKSKSVPNFKRSVEEKAE